MNALSSLAFLNNLPPAFRCSNGILDDPSGRRMSIGTPEAIVRIGDRKNPYGNSIVPAAAKRCRWSFGVRTEFKVQLVRIYRPVRKRNLIVVRVIEGFRKRVSQPGNRSDSRTVFSTLSSRPS